MLMAKLIDRASITLGNCSFTNIYARECIPLDTRTILLRLQRISTRMHIHVGGPQSKGVRIYCGETSRPLTYGEI